MGARAQVIIDTASARESWLHLRVSPYTRPMTLEARMNGRVLATAWLSARTPQDLDLGPVWLEAGTGNSLDLTSEEGCVVPDDLDPHYYGPNLDGIGYRCVSFKVEKIEVRD